MSGHGFPDHIDSKGRGHWIDPKSTTRLCRRCQMLFRADVRDSLRTCAACRPVHRVPAWRVPNEDGNHTRASFWHSMPPSDWRRVMLVPPGQHGTAASSWLAWDACTAPSDDGSCRSDFRSLTARAAALRGWWCFK